MAQKVVLPRPPVFKMLGPYVKKVVPKLMRQQKIQAEQIRAIIKYNNALSHAAKIFAEDLRKIDEIEFIEENPTGDLTTKEL